MPMQYASIFLVIRMMMYGLTRLGKTGWENLATPSPETYLHLSMSYHELSERIFQSLLLLHIF